jgi:long-chain acyl-CoA synthetase
MTNSTADTETLHSRFQDCVKKFGGETALIFKNKGTYEEITWTVFGRSVRYVALALARLGVSAGDRVAILAENRPEWAVSDLAILSAGGVTVPIYQTNTSREVAYILNDSEARILIVSTIEQLGKVESVRQEVPALQQVVIMDTVEAPETLSMDKLWQMGRDIDAEEPELYERHAIRRTSSDTATIIYTSGTTGAPKGVMLTHKNILFNCDASQPVVPVSEKDTCLSFLPLSHVFERTVGQFFMIFNGVTIAYAESIDTVSENLVEVRPTLVISVPRLFEKMYARVLDKVHDSPKLRQKIFFWGIGLGKKLTPYRLRGEAGPPWLRKLYGVADHLVFVKIRERLGGRLRYFVSGGAPLSREIAEFFYAAGVTIIEGYGLTETSPVIAANRHDKIKFGAIGLPLPGVEVKIAADGEILTRSPSVMKGYYKKEEATREVIDGEGWLHTGDVGVIDDDGFIAITDRKKDIIVTSGGKNVAPQNIENLLVSDKYIHQVMVYGDKRKYITALLVPDFDAVTAHWKSRGVSFSSRKEMIEDSKIHDFLFDRVQEKLKDLARYEQIKKIALLDHELTQEAGSLTPTMKLRRKIVTKEYFELLDSLYEKEF